MNTVGSDNPLDILSFDHRGTFQSHMFGWKGKPTSEQSEQITSAKEDNPTASCDSYRQSLSAVRRPLQKEGSCCYLTTMAEEGRLRISVCI
jgi:hypothetical protein